jgi:hypothetical protein
MALSCERSGNLAGLALFRMALAHHPERFRAENLGIGLLSVPKIRFCNNSDEVRQGRAQIRCGPRAGWRDGSERLCRETDESSTRYSRRHTSSESGASARQAPTRSRARSERGDHDPPPTKWSDLRYVSTSRRTAMARKRYKAEEIIAKLRQVDVLVSQGQDMADAIRQIGVSEVTYYRWLFLVQLYRWFPSVLSAITIIRPGTLVRASPCLHRAGASAAACFRGPRLFGARAASLNATQGPARS